MTSLRNGHSRGLVAILAPLLVIGVCLLTYVNSFAAGFVFDDLPSLVHHASIRSWPAAIFNTSRPLTQATFLLNDRLTGFAPASLRLMNVFFHTLAALFLFGSVRRTALSHCRTLSPATVTLISALAASLWAAHPLQTESVTYIIQRSEVLAGMFLLLCLYAFIRSLTARLAHPWLSLSLAACALGMASKPIMIVAPLLILLYDRTFAAGSLRHLWDKRKGYYILLASTWLILLAILLSPTESDRSTGLAAGVLRPVAYFCEQQTVIWHYITLIFAPRSLCLDYGWLPEASRLQTALAASALTAFLLAAIWLFLHQRAIGFCLLWFFTALLPTSSFFPLADLAVEHRVYVALAGVAGLVATAAFTIASGSPRRQGFTIFTLAILAGLLIQSSRMRNEDYRSQLTIYEQVLRLRPEHLRARVAFTEALLDSGDFARAEACVDLTLTKIDRTLKAPVGTFHPFRVRIADYYLATVNDQRGRVRFAQGAYAEAEQCFVDALALDPDNAIIFSNLAAARLLLNRPDDALAAAQQAIALRPSYARSYALAAQAHLALGVTHTAVEAMRRSMDAAIAPGPSATDLETLRDAWLSHPRPVTAPGP